MSTPILAPDGRTTLHRAKTADAAKRWLMKNLGDHSVNLVRKHGFRLEVWLREAWVAEMNGGPVGWMYSIGR